MSIFRWTVLWSTMAAGVYAAVPTTTLRAGAAKADITPETEVLNWVTGKPYGTVHDPLSVHALVLDDGTTKAALLRWDLVDVSESARDEVRQAVGGALGIPGENIMVNASHNHSAPWSPVYREGYRGKERDTWWAIRYMPAQNQFPPYKRWTTQLIAACVVAAGRANEGARAVTMEIGRIAADDFLYNRRPRAPAWGLAEPRPSAPIQYNHPDWNPEVLQGGARFGPMDRTLALVSFRDADNQAVASLFHLACHAVSIYPSNPAISADWPGAASLALNATLGGESLFLQGCCGDINPWRRGEPAVAKMAEGLAAKAQIASRYAAKLVPAPLQVAAATVNLPLTAEAGKRIGNMVVAAEIQVIVCGPLAIVGLPGEPMTELGMSIREKSPFPQTLVLGYTNGNGAHYVGMPGEKARGGYEAGVAGAGTDESALLMVDTALRVLNDVFERPGYRRR
jgi:neutral ceramidase